MIYRTSTYYKIRKIKSKIKVIQGGQGAGKNIAIAQILLEDCSRDKDITTVMSDTYDNLKDGAISDFKMLYENMGLNWERDYNKTDHDLRHNGGLIQFRYISDTKKQAGKSKRRGKLYLNECNKMEQWQAEDSLKYKLRKTFFNEAQKYVAKERSRHARVPVTDSFYYTLEVLHELLRDVWSHEGWTDTPDMANEFVTHSSKPSEGGNRLALLSDVQAGLDRLNDTDRDLLRMRYSNGVTVMVPLVVAGGQPPVVVTV